MDNPFAQLPDPELHPRWTIRQYLDHPAISRSDLWKVYDDSPYEYLWDTEHDTQEETDPMRLGTAIHTAVLEPDEWSNQIVVYEGKRDKRVKKYQEFLEGPGYGKTIITPKQQATAFKVRDYVNSLKGYRALLDEGVAEHTLIWSDFETSERCKARPDFLHKERGWVWDVKSTSENLKSLWPLMRAVMRYGYHLQAAMIERGLAANDIKLTDYWILWVRTQGAPLSRLTRLPLAALAEGRDIFYRAIETYHQCKLTKNWPPPPYQPEDLIWETKQ